MNPRRKNNLGSFLLFVLVVPMGAVSIAAAESDPSPVCIGPGPGYQIVRVRVSTPAELATLLRLAETDREIEIWMDHPAIGNVEVRLPAQSKQLLEAFGLEYSITVADLQAHYDELFPQRGGDFFATFRTYDEHVTFMRELAAAYPDLAAVIDLGVSVQGRPLLALKISRGSSPKPTVMYHGPQHGNEVHGAVVVAHFARHLLEQYSEDPQIQELVDGLRFYLLPIVNPDGYQIGSRANAHGVDLNRNWTGPGAPGRFTEPESAAMRDFFLRHENVRAHLDLHGYREDIMWPWGHTSGLCPDHTTFKMLANRLNHTIQKDGGPFFSNRGPIYTTIYPVVGGSIDHTYNAYGIWAFVFELTGLGGPSELEAWAEHMTRGLTDLSLWVLDCRLVHRGGPTDCNANGTLDSCEANTDADNFIDACDDDIDGDGYPNTVDACTFVPAAGLPRQGGWPSADFDNDCLVTLADYEFIHDCLPMNGPGVTPSLRRCRNIDFDGDDDVDLLDISEFFNQFE